MEMEMADRVSAKATWNGQIAVTMDADGEGLSRSFLFDGKYAMRLWRCLMGELGHVHLESLTPMLGTKEKVDVSYVDEGFRWKFVAGSREIGIDCDQALLLAWAIKSVVTSIALESESFKGSYAKSVFVLSARRMLTGDCAENGVDQIGGTERVFANERDARDNVREFMRPLVNESFGEAYWEERNVDDVLDDIFAAADAIYNPEEPTVWLCEGQKQSFVVELARREVQS